VQSVYRRRFCTQSPPFYGPLLIAHALSGVNGVKSELAGREGERYVFNIASRITGEFNVLHCLGCLRSSHFISVLMDSRVRGDVPASHALMSRCSQDPRRRSSWMLEHRAAEAEGKQIESCLLVANDRLPLLGKLREGLASIVPCGRFYVQRPVGCKGAL
jgi:hypothetical protein